MARALASTLSARVLLLVAEDPALALGHDLVAELARGQGVAPVAEGALRELHDVALVHEGQALALELERVAQGRAHQALRPLLRDGLDPDGARLREADLLDLHLGLQPGDDLLRLRRARGPLHAGVDVLRVLAEEDHVHVLRPLHRAGHALEVAHRAQADVEVELLAQGDVEGADAAAHRRRERSLDPDQVLAERVQRLRRHPFLRLVEGLLAGQHLEPGDLALAPVGLLHRRVEDALRRAPDVAPGAVALDVGDDRMVRDTERSAADGDGFAGGRGQGHGMGPRRRRNRAAQNLECIAR